MAVMVFHDFFDDGEPEPGALGAHGNVGLGQLFAVILGKAAAVVFDGQGHDVLFEVPVLVLPGTCAEGDMDLALGRLIPLALLAADDGFGGILKKIGQGAENLTVVAIKPDVVCGQVGVIVYVQMAVGF